MTRFQEALRKMRVFLRKNGALVLISAFFVLEALSLSVVLEGSTNDPADLLVRRGPAGEESGTAVQKEIPRISDIRGPRIDDEAAMIVVDESSRALSSECFTLPVEMWMFVFLMYVALLVFNLAYAFDRPAGEMRIQWFWETLYTLAFLCLWYVWDGCRMNVWFPLSIVKTGLFVYAAYLYFFDRCARK